MTTRRTILCFSLFVLFSSTARASVNDGIPVFKIAPVESSIKFDVEASVAIKGTFEKWDSTKIEQTGPDTFNVDGTFTIRGVAKQERLTLKVDGVGTGSGTINGTMAFDRKQFGMNSGIPFIKIADRVEVAVKLKANRVSGPPVVLKQ
jgi:hypothetical protein